MKPSPLSLLSSFTSRSHGTMHHQQPAACRSRKLTTTTTTT
uniref:Uncharacterized protein n=1 Tax=Anopheles dirus TaxID=7168 RepID=A0A182NYS0_9DIPT